jgi:hypothetical protein
MMNDTPDQPSATAARANAHRERFRKTSAIKAQAARAKAAGGPPNKDDTARMVAEFHA